MLECLWKVRGNWRTRKKPTCTQQIWAQDQTRGRGAVRRHYAAMPPRWIKWTVEIYTFIWGGIALAHGYHIAELGNHGCLHTVACGLFSNHANSKCRSGWAVWETYRKVSVSVHVRNIEDPTLLQHHLASTALYFLTSKIQFPLRKREINVNP